MPVHSELGNGFLEAVCHDALEREFREVGIPHSRESKISTFSKGHRPDEEYFADFICFEKIIAESKCAARLVTAHKAQVMNHLHATGRQVGLPVNFGEASLKWERLAWLKGRGHDLPLGGG